MNILKQYRIKRALKILKNEAPELLNPFQDVIHAINNLAKAFNAFDNIQDPYRKIINGQPYYSRHGSPQ
jgi:hypothetical protein